MNNESSSIGLTIGLALLVGFVTAAMLDHYDGVLLGAMIGGLLAQIVHLRKRTQRLSDELQALRTGTARADVEAPKEQAEPRAAPPVAQPAPATAQPTTPQVRSPIPASRIPPREFERPLAPSRAPSEPPAFDRMLEAGLAWLKRGNPLARLGIAILFVGAAFLAKYAAEHDLFPIELRFIALALLAATLLALGWRLRKSRPIYAQLLQGGGVAGLYLTVFAAMRLHHLLPLGLGFGLMVVIAAAAAILAVAQNALSLAVIGTAGGFLAPILASSGSGDHVALFSYYAILNLGVFAIAWFRTWRVLNVLGFVFTFGVTALWRVTGYERAELVSADGFLVLFFLMYVGVSILNSARQPPNLKNYVSGALVFGLPVVAFTIHATLVAHIEYALALSALTLCAFYVGLAWLLFRTGRESFHLLAEAFAALGVIFASLAIPLAFDTRTTAAMWAVEGAGLIWLGLRQERKLARAFGALLQVGGGLGYLAGLPAARGDIPVLNTACLGAAMLAIAGVASGYWLFRNRERRASYEAGADYAFAIWGVAWWMFGGLTEIALFLRDQALGAALAYVAASAALLCWLGVTRAWPLPRIAAAYLPTLAMVVGFAYAAGAHPFIEWGAAGWIAIFAAHFGVLRVHESHALEGRAWLHAGACWALALLTAWESSWRIAERTTGVWPSLPWGLAPAAIVAWLGRRTLAPRWPLTAHIDAYRVTGAAPLVAATAIWIAWINLSNRGDTAWLPYLPLLNPLDVAVALCFTAGALWWTALDDGQRSAAWPFDVRALFGLFAALAFVWLNAALIRTLHHNWGAPITAYGLVHSTLVQSALSIFWGVLGFAAMLIAARRRWRSVWLTGAALMIVVVAKLFLVDLSSVGTIARIASFLSVGALLLATGYFAPLPPRRELETADWNSARI